MRALPVRAVPLLPPPGAAAPLRRRRELRQVPHAGALPHGFVPDAHAEELDGPSRARARVVPVVPALRAPPGPVAPATAGARRRRRRRAVTHHGDWTGGIWLGLVAGGIPFFSPRGFFFYPLTISFLFLGVVVCIYLVAGKEAEQDTARGDELEIFSNSGRNSFFF